jgi:enoyl-CoA hydratase/carnithine racemase
LRDGVSEINFNRPEKLNTLTPDVYLKMDDPVKETTHDDDCKIILLHGTGPAFSSGFDLKLQMRRKSTF